jgi:hypothetical protein
MFLSRHTIHVTSASFNTFIAARLGGRTVSHIARELSVLPKHKASVTRLIALPLALILGRACVLTLRSLKGPNHYNTEVKCVVYTQGASDV